MLRCTLLVALLVVTYTLPAAPQAVDAVEGAAKLAEVLPEPPEWMMWLCGIAVAVVIALRRLRGSGLSE